MHDPMTQAFVIRYPWKRSRVPKSLVGTKYEHGEFITIWHVDPEKRYPGRGRDDDSCDWFGSYRPLDPREMTIVEALWDLQTVVENEPFYGSDHYHTAHDAETGKREVYGALGRRYEALQNAVRVWRQRRRSWWQHPRWHIWHWKIQIHPVQQFKRWAFSRCVKCGKGFSWGYAPVTGQWHSKGPRWFRSEPHVYHETCA